MQSTEGSHIEILMARKLSYFKIFILNIRTERKSSVLVHLKAAQNETVVSIVASQRVRSEFVFSL